MENCTQRNLFFMPSKSSMPGKNAADMEKIFLREKLFSSSGMNRDSLCFVRIDLNIPWIGGGADCCRLHSDDCSMGHRRFSQSQRAGVRWRKGFSFHPERTDFILPGENRRCSDMPDTGIMIKAFPVLQKVPGERRRSGNIWRLRAFMLCLKRIQKMHP